MNTISQIDTGVFKLSTSWRGTGSVPHRTGPFHLSFSFMDIELFRIFYIILLICLGYVIIPNIIYLYLFFPNNVHGPKKMKKQQKRQICRILLFCLVSDIFRIVCFAPVFFLCLYRNVPTYVIVSTAYQHFTYRMYLIKFLPYIQHILLFHCYK